MNLESTRYSSAGSTTDALSLDTPVRPYNRYTSPEEIENLFGGISDPPRRTEKILRNFDLLLPKFHFILPNFYLGPP